MPPQLPMPPILPPWMTGEAPPVPTPTMPPPPQTIGPAPEAAPPLPTEEPVETETIDEGEDPLVAIVRALIEGAILADADGNAVADFSILPPELRDAIKQVLLDYTPTEPEGAPAADETPVDETGEPLPTQ